MEFKFPYLNQLIKRHQRLAGAGLGVVVAIASLGVAGCKEEAPAGEQIIPVRVASVTSGPRVIERQYTGTVKARYESDLGFRVGGKISARRVNVGDRVKAGSTIATLDAADFKLALEQQEAELAAAKSSRDTAIAAEERYETLKKKGWVAQAALDQRVAAADEAIARVLRAERALEVSKNQVTYTDLVADHDGVVTALNAEAGQVMAAGQVVARLARLDELEAVVPVPEHLLEEVKNAGAKVALWPNERRFYNARVREISPEADSTARTFDVRFSISDADANVQLGKTATVTLSETRAEAGVRLPLSAVSNDAKGAHVWIVNADDRTVARRAVAIASYDQESVMVATGLASGERVVTLGIHRLDEGSIVRIVENRTLAATANAALR